MHTIIMGMNAYICSYVHPVGCENLLWTFKCFEPQMQDGHGDKLAGLASILWEWFSTDITPEECWGQFNYREPPTINCLA